MVLFKDGNYNGGMGEGIYILGDGVTAQSVRQYASTAAIPIVSIENADIVITSPGIPPSDFPKTKAPIISDIQWAYDRFQAGSAPPHLIAVTGTNGKSTVTTMISHILDIPSAGNIGIPLINYVGLEHEYRDIVVEVSSYQLETCTTFRPNISVFLNITPDHLSRHQTLENYASQKAKCTTQQMPDDFMVFYEDDPILPGFLEDSLAQPVPFTLAEANALPKLPNLPGTHNALNMMAAIKTVECLGVSEAIALSALAHYKPLRHRLELVAVVNQRQFYNDSKATNPDATSHAVKAFSTPPWLILCGEDKELDLIPFIASLSKKVAGIAIFGEIAPKLAPILAQCPSLQFYEAEALQSAFEWCVSNSKEGDTILFSPSSSSQDQYKNFEDRGDAFVECVTHYAETSLV